MGIAKSTQALPGRPQIQAAIDRGLRYVKDSPLVMAAVKNFSVKLASLLSGNPEGKVMTDIYLLIDEAIGLNKDVQSGAFLLVSGKLTKAVSTALLQYAAATIAKPGGPKASAAAIAATGLAAAAIDVVGTIVVEFLVGAAISP